MEFMDLSRSLFILSKMTRPQLHNGQPVHRRHVSVPSALELCSCTGCSQRTTIDPMTRKVVPGDYVGHKTRLEHQRIDNKRAAASAWTPTLSTPPNPDDSNSESDPPHAVPKPNRKQRNVKIDHFSAILERIREGLTERSAATVVDGKPLVFLVPPTSTSPPIGVVDRTKHSEINSGPLALTYYGGHVNSAVTSYEEWLFSSHLAIESGIKHRHASVRLRTITTLRLLADELDEVERLKTEEWERQRVAECVGESERVSTSTSSRGRTVDTGMFQSTSVYSAN
jgi:hypothetical protein